MAPEMTGNLQWWAPPQISLFLGQANGLFVRRPVAALYEVTQISQGNSLRSRVMKEDIRMYVLTSYRLQIADVPGSQFTVSRTGEKQRFFRKQS